MSIVILSSTTGGNVQKQVSEIENILKSKKVIIKNLPKNFYNKKKNT